MSSINVSNAFREKHTVFTVKDTDGAQLQSIVLEELPEWFVLFAQKNAEYGENAQVLGDKGQFADMWRKMGKLKTALWDGHEDRLVSEGVDEILRDLIGHCFLTLQMRSSDRAAAELAEANRSFSAADFAQPGAGILNCGDQTGESDIQPDTFNTFLD